MTTGPEHLRKILHLDLDAFFCAVEEKYSPNLRGKPFAVGGPPESRGVVASCSYAARKRGVRSAMPMARAVRLCPDLIVLSHRHGKYGEESRKVMEIVRQMAGLIEQISIDEAFLDVTDSPEPSETLARRIQHRIWDELELPCSLGAATNKLVAKIATDFGKSQAEGVGPPNAICVVPPGDEAAFLAPLPAAALWGVGPKTAARLAALGIHTIGDIAARQTDELVRLFGKHGKDLARRARGIDDSPIEESHEVKSISREVTFARDLSDARALRNTLRELSEDVARQLLKSELIGTTVKIKLRWPDFRTITRQTTLALPTDQEVGIYAAAEKLFKSAWLPARRPVRLLGVGVSGLAPAREPYRQLKLWEAKPLKASEEDPEVAARRQRLNQAVEELQEQFGDDSIQLGRGGGEREQAWQVIVGRNAEPASSARSVLVLIPAYNAADRIGPVVRRANRILPVLVVDDGSGDETGKRAADSGARVLRQDPNQGKGAALKAGFTRALAEEAEAVITLDADGQHDPSEIPLFLQAWEERRPDLVIGARDFSQMPLTRRVANTLGRWSFSWAMGQAILDNQSGYRLLSRQMMEAVLKSEAEGFEFEVETIVRCVQMGYVLDWVTIKTIYAGEGSHIKPWQHVVNFSRLVVDTRRRMRRNKA